VALYTIASNSAQYATDFFDVTTGNNTQPPAPNAANLLPTLVSTVNHH
jgi:hypothetical protein